MRKPTLHDVARAAGVSYATADRVLNARGLVAEKSRLRVQNAIKALGYERDLHAANLSRRRVYRFGFVLPLGDHSFFGSLRDAVAAEQVRRKADRVSVETLDFPAFDPDRLAARLEAIEPGFDCLAVVGADTPRLTAAIEALSRAGTPVVTLVGDAAPAARAAYVGIDNLIAGATAGRLLRLAHLGRDGRVLPVLGAFSARDHAERLEGALRVLAEAPTPIERLPAIEVHDRQDVMFDRISAAVAQREITGIYSIGAGNRGLLRALEGLQGPRPFVVTHELTPTTRDGLERGVFGAVIDQKPAQEVALAMDVMKDIADGRAPPGPTLLTTPTIYLKDNLPAKGGRGAWT